MVKHEHSWRAGIWLLCLYEKTSLQAREGEQPPRPAQSGKPMLHEARYQRHGARQSVCCTLRGRWPVYGLCRSRKCFVDFQTFLLQLVIPLSPPAQGPHADPHSGQCTTHAPKQLEGWLREQEVACEGQLHFQVLWLPTNASWLDQLEIWFSVLQRKHLQPNHFLSTTALETSLHDYIAYYNQAAKPINCTYTVEKLNTNLNRNSERIYDSLY